MSSLGGFESMRDYLQSNGEWVETMERGRTIKKRRTLVPASTLPPLTLFPPPSLDPTSHGLDVPFSYALQSTGGYTAPFAVPSDPALFRLSTNPTKASLDTSPFLPLPGFPVSTASLVPFTLQSILPPQSTLESLAALCGDLFENGSQPSPMDSTFSDQVHASSSPQKAKEVPRNVVSNSKNRQRRSSISSNSLNAPVRPVAVAVPPREIPRPHHCVHPGCYKSFARPSALKIHARSHSGDRPYACPCCYRAFAAACNLARHMKQIHPEVDVTNVAATEIPDIDVVALTPSPSPPLIDPALSTAPNARKRKKSKKKKKLKYRIIDGGNGVARDEGGYELDPVLPMVEEVEGERVADVLEKWTETSSMIHANESLDEFSLLPQFVPRLYSHPSLPLSPLSPVPEYVPPTYELPPPPSSFEFYHSPPPPQVYPPPIYHLPQFDPSFASSPSNLSNPPNYYPHSFPSQPPPLPPIYNFGMPLPPRYPALFPPTPPPTASINPQNSFDLSQVLMLPPFETVYGSNQRSPVSWEREGGMNDLVVEGIERDGKEMVGMEIP